ncbi:MAG: sulfatase [Planctomycetes bacterium]|nr:sulfatase [Planctomycetota bacterium]
MLSSPRTIAAALVSLLGLGLASCTEQRASRDTGKRPNVLVIVVDTLRADKLGCHGNVLGLTPNIDTLAAQSVRFERAYSHAPWTLPAFASLFSSLHPPQHGAGGQLPDFRQLPDSVRTIAECFHDAGFATAAVINVDFLCENFGMTQGFADVDFKAFPNNVNVRSATDTTAAAVAWLQERNRRPFFLLVHYFDPHLVYAPPAEYRRKYAAPQDREDSSWVFGTRRQIAEYRMGRVRFDEATIRRAEQLYDGEVAYTDHEVGRLLAALRAQNLADKTVTVFTADHGEEFMDHGGFEHGHTLFQELVHVPLLIRFPQRLRPQTIAAAVGHIDVAPTLCALTGVTADPAFVGHSLLPLMEGSVADRRPLAFEGNFWGPPFRGWLQGGYKLIAGPQGVQLFNLVSDPGEQHDLSGERAEQIRKMQEDMQLAFKAMEAKSHADGSAVQLSPAERQRLESLGYMLP